MTNEQIFEQLKSRMSRETWNNWLTNTTILDFSNGVVTIGVGNIFIKQTIEMKFGSIIKDTLSDILAQNVSVVFKETTIDISKPTTSTGPLIKNRPLKLSDINSEFTFDTFVVGDSNRLAYYSAMEVAKNPGKFTPLFIYGDVGLGKTHVMQSIGNYVMDHSPDLRVKYLTAEDFMNDMLKCIKSHDMDGFRERFRKNVDILLIDDIQFLIGKDTIQTELFHTFNSLFNYGKQVVICSDRTPEELATFHPRLISRFEMGLVVNIEEPDLNTKYLITKKMADMISLQINDDVAHYLAEHVDKNIRRLRGAVMNLMLHCKVTGKPADIDVAKKIVASIINMNVSKAKYNTPEVFESVKTNTLINAVLTEFKISKEDLYSSSRKKEVALARQVLAYVLKVYGKMSVNDIADTLKRNHATISQSIKKIDQSLMIGNSVLKSQIDRVRVKIENENHALNAV